MYYRTWIQRALDYIEANLMSTVDPRAVAREAGFSVYHFHRVFKGAVGESVADYVRRRRLTEAAERLLNTRERIVEVALRYQFESQASFTRAFRRVFGMTPGQYRRNRQSLLLLERPCLDGAGLSHLCDGISLQPKVVFRPSMQVVGLPYRGTNRSGEIPSMWSVFQRLVEQVPNRREPEVTLGVCLPIFHLTAESEIDWLWAVELEAESGSLPDGMITRNVPAGHYAVFVHRADVDRLEETYQYIHGVWLPHSGFVPANTPDFERYDAREPGVVTIYIPLLSPSAGSQNYCT
jgi:AraC family transcriptional regulator